MYKIERRPFQRCHVKEGYLYLSKSCRSGWYDCYSFDPRYGDLYYQFGFKPDKDSFESAWDIVIGNYENGNIYFVEDEVF